MSMEQAAFRRYWQGTEVIRSYQRMLSSFGDTRLPYVFAAEHSNLRDRVVVQEGFIHVHTPTILVPSRGPEFGQGFEAVHIPEQIFLFMRSAMPYCRVDQQTRREATVEYGTLQEVLNKHVRKLEEDEETGLIKGIVGGHNVSLMLYFGMVASRSSDANVREILEHIGHQRRGPIGPDEGITDEEMRRLLEGQ